MSATPEPIVIVNTSPLLYLHQINHLNLLQALYKNITAPVAVQQELEIGRQQGIDVPAIDQIPWIQLRQVESISLVPAVIDLGQGETAVIALGLEIHNSLLILDDQLGRRIANLCKLKYTGTIGVLVKAKQTGLIESVGAALSQLQSKGMWLSDTVIHEARRLAGEG